MKKIDLKTLPRHIGMIMDGNGRWAAKKLLPRSAGHRAGVKTLSRMVNAVFSLRIPYLTVYAFSTENTARPKTEVKGLLNLIRRYFDKELPRFIKNGIRMRVIGDRTYFSDEIQKALTNAEKQTGQFKDKTFVVALNYGARNEIVRAVFQATKLERPVTEAEFAEFLDTSDLPDPDMIVRTGGEQRLSNFLLYQSAYAELFFISDLWPDFSKEKLLELLEEYGKRVRRFGR